MEQRLVEPSVLVISTCKSRACYVRNMRWRCSSLFRHARALEPPNVCCYPPRSQIHHYNAQIQILGAVRSLMVYNGLEACSFNKVWGVDFSDTLFWG
jgi:hypothetical protein